MANGLESNQQKKNLSNIKNIDYRIDKAICGLSELISNSNRFKSQLTADYGQGHK